MKEHYVLLVSSFVLLTFGYDFNKVEPSKIRSLYAQHYDVYKHFVNEYKQGVLDERPEPERLLAFVKTVERIKKHNALYEEGKTTYKLGLNHMADMSQEDFDRNYPTVVANITVPINTTKHEGQHILSKAVNWVKKGYVSPVREQGNCYSAGYAFAVAGALEGLHYRKEKEMIQLSGQQLLDCAGYGCNEIGSIRGGTAYVSGIEGLMLEKDYPYTGAQGSCKYNAQKAIGGMNGYYTLSSNDTNSLKSAIARGPTAVHIFSNSPDFRTYKEGIYTCRNTPPFTYSHSMLAVGYGNGYIRLKNTWGTQWGEKGYMRISDKLDESCNIALVAVKPF